MTSSTSNIEAVARDICSKQLSHHGGCGANPVTYVDRYWHCVASEMEAGLIDDDGKPIPNIGLDEGLKAYSDWCRRHPESNTI